MQRHSLQLIVLLLSLQNAEEAPAADAVVAPEAEEAPAADAAAAPEAEVEVVVDAAAQ